MEQYLSTKELMEGLGISRSTVYRLIERGMPFIKVGSVNRFPKEQVLAWLGAGEEREGATHEKTIPPGDYRCLQCLWTGHVEEPRLLSQMTCPQCRTIGRVERV